MRTEAGSAPRGSRARAGSALRAGREESAQHWPETLPLPSSRWRFKIRGVLLTSQVATSTARSRQHGKQVECPTVTPQRRAAASRPRPPLHAPPTPARPAHSVHFPPIPEVGLGALARGSSRSSRPPHTFELYLHGARGAGERAPPAPRCRCSSTRKPGPRSQGQGASGLRHVPRRTPAGPGPRRRAPISVSGSKHFRSQRSHLRGRW